jgi:hypothetical protein
MGAKIKAAIEIASKIGQQNPGASEEELFRLIRDEFDKHPAVVRALCETAILDHLQDEGGNPSH